MDRRTDWIVRNGALAVALYFALVHQVSWLPYLIAVFAWSMLGITVWAISAPVRRLAFVPVSEAATMTFDLAVLGSMFVAHWYWTACAYAMARGCAAIIRARTPSKP
ncbi:MAG TPA: hypothetical protein VLI21_05735 [Casimicrobiaceae bacterium]|jgi:hypothetical protein|nr:hypothetical protein [Casimicrobiaceae bacterium]